MGTLVGFLIAFPLVAGAILLAVSRPGPRAAIVTVAGAVIAAASIAAAYGFGNGAAVFFGLPGGVTLGMAPFVLEVALGLFLVAVSVRHRRWDALVLAAAQLGITAWIELRGGHHGGDPARLFAFDRLSMLMVLIVGVIGSLICVHALGYMRDYHRHYPRLRGRRTVFFFLVFAFLSAMFGLVTANQLPLLHLFWEITTLCSFLLIGYTRTRETIGYAFNALSMNLLGGVAFSLAIALLGRTEGGLDLARLAEAPAGAALLPAVALLAFAGITKSAQMPFSSWLLGAMHAPTPTSALLHSSTMVKAGVFLLLKLAPAMAGSDVGTAVTLVGLGTFLFVSLVAATEPNAKKVLAYSTIGNLGLVVACAGVATPETVWVGVLIIVFHAVAKSLLFLVVGTLENRLYSKDLEHWDNLLSRFPRASLLALVGVGGMFLAPFGIVLAKWSAIRAFLEVPGWRGAVYLIIMAYGSACTIYYWAKLLLKILAVRRIPAEERAIEARVSGFEWLAEHAHAVLVLGLTVGIGALSAQVVTPYALDAFGEAPRVLLHLAPVTVVVLVATVLALPALALRFARGGKYDPADIYVGGRSVDDAHVVGGALGGRQAVSLRNYYLGGVLDGALAFRVGTALCAAVLIVTFVVQVIS